MPDSSLCVAPDFGKILSAPDPQSRALLGELIDVLKPHSRGLRRWSVMKALRDNRRRKSRDIPQKFEDDVERVFRQFSRANDELLYRPKDAVGEVWALHPKLAASLAIKSDLSQSSRWD